MEKGRRESERESTPLVTGSGGPAISEILSSIFAMILLLLGRTCNIRNIKDIISNICNNIDIVWTHLQGFPSPAHVPRNLSPAMESLKKILALTNF